MLNFELLTSFIDTEFPNCVGAFVTGSYALGTNSPTSDIDIVIITRNGEPQTLECREFEGALLELSIFSQNECKHILNRVW